jgi:hypothetical protein
LSSTPKPEATSAPAGTQIKGRAGVFSHYRLRVAGVIRDYGMSERHEQAPKDSASVSRG